MLLELLQIIKQAEQRQLLLLQKLKKKLQQQPTEPIAQETVADGRILVAISKENCVIKESS
jgi:hypothetical protein